MKNALKHFPEIIGLPLALLGLLLTPYLLELTHIQDLFNWVNSNPSEPNRVIMCFQAISLTISYVFIANFAAYAAIKYNNLDLWTYYTQEDFTDIEREDLLKYYWWRYFASILAVLVVNTYLMIMM